MNVSISIIGLKYGGITQISGLTYRAPAVKQFYLI